MGQLITVKGLGEYAQLHPSTIYKLVETGEIPFIKRKGLGIRFKEDEIANWLDQGSLKINSIIEHLPQVDLSISAYDKLFLCKKGGVKMSPKGKTWNYPFGSVYLRQSKSEKGRWYIYYRVEGRRVRESVRGAQSRADALKVLILKVSDAFRGRHGFKKGERTILFKDFAGEYLEKYAKPNKRSWKTDDYSLKICKSFFHGTFLNAIGARAIEEFKSDRLAKGNSPARVNRYLSLLKKMFNLAMDWGYLTENPARKVRKFSEKDNLKERILTAAEEAKLIAHCAAHLRPIVVTALNTGMRRGEILSLRWSQVDLERRTLRVERTKSGKCRLLPINDVIADELGRLRKASIDSDHVFVNPNTKVRFTDVKTGFRAAMRRAGLEGLRFHDLRHTFASRLVERGVDLITVKDLLGHASVTTTERYTHSGAEQKRRAVELLTQVQTKKVPAVLNLSTEIGATAATSLYGAN